MKDVETVEIGETSDEKESSSEEVTQEKESKEKNSKASFIKELLVYAVIIILCVTIVPRYVIQRTQVDGRSMMNTLHDEESLLVEKVTYHFKNPDRFDIITFYPQGRDHEGTLAFFS